MPSLYGSGWRRPRRCECNKIPYRDETAALAAAASRGEDAGVALTVYKCPGSSSWHLTGRGFHPRALRSRPRILAWHLSARRVVDRTWLYRELGAEPMTPAARKIGRTLRALADLGLVTLDDPRRGYVTVADHDGLRRVMQVGLEEYAESRGHATRRAARPEAVTDPNTSLPAEIPEDGAPNCK